MFSIVLLTIVIISMISITSMILLFEIKILEKEGGHDQ